jgi:hypothetical protein
MTPEEHFTEFKKIISSAGGQVLEDNWLGSKKRHKILLDDKETTITPTYAKLSARFKK